MSLRHLLTVTALAALTLATASVQAQTTPQNGGRLRALIAQKQAAATDAALPAGVQRIADVPYGVDPAQRGASGQLVGLSVGQQGRPEPRFTRFPRAA